MTLKYFNMYFDKCEPTIELMRFRQCRYPGKSTISVVVDEFDVQYACSLLEFEFDTLVNYLRSVSEEDAIPTEPAVYLADEYDLLNVLWECAAAAGYKDKEELKSTV